MRRRLLAVMLAAVAAVVIAQPGSTAGGRDGGILRVSFSPQVPLDYVDPALSFSPPGWSLLDATCARLYTYPDKWSPTSFRLQPEVADGYSRSADLKTYRFTLRSNFRFSNGEPVRASAFRHAINRALQPVVHSPGAIFMRDIVGADDVLSGRAKTARGVVARGNTLVVRFKRPAPDFLARTTLPFFCAVPPWLPVSGEGLPQFPSAGPYYVKEYRETEGIVVRRNGFYGGERKVHLEGFKVNLRGGTPVDLLRSIERGDADWGYMLPGVFMTPDLDFEAKYGLNKSRFWMWPGLTVRMLAFNSSRPLFRNNPRLRRAVNFALDRRALVAALGGPVAVRATDQLLPPGVPGFHDVKIYPSAGNLERARALARGQRRDAKAVLYVENYELPIAAAQLVKKQLARIGLEVDIEIQAGGAEYQAQLTNPGAAWDIAFVLELLNIPDAHAYLSRLLATRVPRGEPLTRVRSKLAQAALARAARLQQARARSLVYAEVDEMIARDVAPVAVLSVYNEGTIVSKRVGCLTLRPALDLAVACLKK